jgi:hypothetical protein
LHERSLEKQKTAFESMNEKKCGLEEMAFGLAGNAGNALANVLCEST